MSGIQPHLMALLVCDAIHQDPATGKHTLLGLFSAIGAPRFPAVQPVLAVYAALTEGYGAFPVELRIVDAGGGDPIWRAEVQVRCEDPRAVVELAFRAERVAFPDPGDYRVQLHAAGHFLMERRLMVRPTGP